MSPVGSLFALGLGLAGSSFFTFGNFANGVTGIGAIQAKPALRKLNAISVSQRVELWGIQYDHGKVWFPVAIVTSVIGYGFAAITLANIRRLLFTAIGASVLSGALIVTLAPTNAKLVALRDAIHQRRFTDTPQQQTNLSGDSGLSDANMQYPDKVELLNVTEQETATTLIVKWGWLHRARVLANSIGWVAGFAAAVLV
ncbi:hypothetical protein DL93DRAFT_347259 [Clavulina sp. PMI_390]|nr:hypothetical protein DL93DRAFT_347259 [Clavulina sp. PMI_390]